MHDLKSRLATRVQLTTDGLHAYLAATDSAFGTDIDSVAGWIGSYGGGDSPSDIQRGIFASEVGNIRLLKLFKKYKLPTTFFIPGTAETRRRARDRSCAVWNR